MTRDVAAASSIAACNNPTSSALSAFRRCGRCSSMVTTSPSRLTPSICPSPLSCVPVLCFTLSGRTVGSVTATPDVDILVIGAGQAGLSVGYHLRRLGLTPERDFLIVDHSPAPGGAWQFRWPSLTLSTVNRVHDLPGMSFAETMGADAPGGGDVQA